MATSRSGRPAAPTLGGTTTDAARGGFFAGGQTASAGTLQSDVVVNDSTITITINGDSQEFTLNQAMSDELTFTVAGGGSGGSDRAFTGATIDPANPRNIILTRESGQDPVTLTVPEDMMADLTALTNRVTALETAVNNLPDDIVESVSINGGTPVAPDANGNVNLVSPVGTVVVGSQQRVSDSVQELRSIMIGGVQWRVGSGIPTPGPVVPGASQELMNPPPANVFTMPTMTPMQDITITGGTTPADGSGVVVNLMLDGMTVGGDQPTVTVEGGGTMVDVTVPTTSITEPGNYEVETTITVTPSDGGPTTMITETETFDRILPFFQSRSDLIDAAAVLASTASTTAWTGSVTAIAGSGSLFVATVGLNPTTNYDVTAAGGFRLNNRFVRTISITPPGSSNAQTYQVWQVAGIRGGSQLTFTAIS